MKRETNLKRDPANRAVRRRILLVDDNGGDVPLKAAWRQLGLSDVLQSIADPEKAVSLLREEEARESVAPVAAVVLDPETTGEDTRDFLRRLRETASGNAVPIVFWSRDRAKYGAFEDRGVAAVVPKQTVLKVIQMLDAACSLQHQPVQPLARGELARRQWWGNSGVRV